MTLPLIPQDLFLALMIALQIADAWTTYDVIRAGGKEGNPIWSRLMEAIGLREALWVAKLLAIAYFIFWPITDPLTQWVNVVTFGAIALWNYNNLRKLKGQK